MSMSIFLICLRHGESASFKRSIAEEILLRDALDKRLPITSVEYSDDSGGAVYGLQDKEDITGVSFDHCGGEMFFAALYELADRTGAFFVWSDALPCLAVTNEATLAHLPSDIVEGLGPPYIVLEWRRAREGDPRIICRVLRRAASAYFLLKFPKSRSTESGPGPATTSAARQAR